MLLKTETGLGIGMLHLNHTLAIKILCGNSTDEDQSNLLILGWYFLLLDGPSVLRLAQILCRVEGHGWYDGQSNLDLNWKVIKKLLVNQFPKPVPFAKLLR